jgi:hypothetical protein
MAYAIPGIMAGGPMPTKKNLAHMLNGPDDSLPMHRLCTGYVKNFTVNNPSPMMRALDNLSPAIIPQGGLQELEMKFMLISGLDQAAVQLLMSGPCDIIIRRRR